MCNLQFRHSEDLNFKSIKSIEDLNIVDVDYIYSETEKNWPKIAGDIHFEKIYVLEKI